MRLTNGRRIYKVPREFRRPAFNAVTSDKGDTRRGYLDSCGIYSPKTDCSKAWLSILSWTLSLWMHLLCIKKRDGKTAGTRCFLSFTYGCRKWSFHGLAWIVFFDSNEFNCDWHNCRSLSYFVKFILLFVPFCRFIKFPYNSCVLKNLCMCRWYLTKKIRHFAREKEFKNFCSTKNLRRV